jgi:hypothetical protein
MKQILINGFLVQIANNVELLGQNYINFTELMRERNAGMVNSARVDVTRILARNYVIKFQKYFEKRYPLYSVEGSCKVVLHGEIYLHYALAYFVFINIDPEKSVSLILSALEAKSE